MQVGDPKKAVVLGVVALAVVSVAVFRILPSGGPTPGKGATAERSGNASNANEPSPNTQTASAPTTVAANSGPTVTEMPSNPFTHPSREGEKKLEQNPNGEESPKKAPNQQGSDRDEQPQRKPIGKGHKSGSQKLPDVEGGNSPLDPMKNGSQINKEGDLAESESGPAIGDETAVGTKVKLLAIVSLKRPKALFSFNGGAAFSGYTGTNFNSVSIHRIETHFVVIRFGGEQRTLRVGEEVTL